MVGPLDARRIYRCPRSQWSRLPEVSMALVTSQALSHAGDVPAPGVGGVKYVQCTFTFASVDAGV